MNIELYDETKKTDEEAKKLVVSILSFAATYLETEEDAEVSVTFVDDSKIKEINLEYRGIDAPTDVISFAIQEEEDEFLFSWDELEEDIPVDLGDLFISVERAMDQAKEYGHSFERELGFLALHGFLHLNGFDHQNEEDEKEMFDFQKNILKEYGLERRS